MVYKKIFNSIYFIIIGVVLGFMIALSETPILNSVVTGVLSIVATFLAFFSGVQIRGDSLNESNDKKKYGIDNINGGGSSLLLAILMIGMMIGIISGLFTKNQASFIQIDTSKVLNQWYAICKIDEKATSSLRSSVYGKEVDLIIQSQNSKTYVDSIVRVVNQKRYEDSIQILLFNLQIKQQIGLCLLGKVVGGNYEIANDNNMTYDIESVYKFNYEKPIPNANVKSKTKIDDKSSSNNLFLPRWDLLKSGKKDSVLIHQLYYISRIRDFELMRRDSRFSNVSLIQGLENEISNDTTLHNIYMLLWKEL